MPDAAPATRAKARSAEPATSSAAGERTLWQMLDERAREQAHAVALRSKQRGLWRGETWQGWREGSARIAAALAQGGVRAGDRVATVLPDELPWFHAALAASMLGCTFVALPAQARVEQVAHWLELLDCGALLTQRVDLLSALKDVRTRVPKPLLVLSPVAAAEAAAGAARPAPAAAPTISAIAVSGEGEIEHASQADLVRSVATLLGGTAPVRGQHAVIALDLMRGLAARLVLPLAHGWVPCLPERDIDLLATLHDVQPDAVLASAAEWEAHWREVSLRRREAAPLHRRLFDMAMRSAGAAWSPSGLVWAQLREHLGLRCCRIAVSTGGPVARSIGDGYAALGLSFLQPDASAPPALDSELRSIPAVRRAHVDRSADGAELRVELGLDTDAAMRLAAVNGLDVGDAAGLPSDPSLQQLLLAEVRNCCSRDPTLAGLAVRLHLSA